MVRSEHRNENHRTTRPSASLAPNLRETARLLRRAGCPIWALGLMLMMSDADTRRAIAGIEPIRSEAQFWKKMRIFSVRRLSVEQEKHILATVRRLRQH